MNEMYDSKVDTLKHIKTVQQFINDIIQQLLYRAKSHDASKLKLPEKKFFDQYTPKLFHLTYGSKKYKEILKKLKPAVDHHYANNRHHPEYFGEDGIYGMNIIDLIEMLCDWKAATTRHKDGNIKRSLQVSQERFSMSNSLLILLENTIKDMKWE